MGLKLTFVESLGFLLSLLAQGSSTLAPCSAAVEIVWQAALSEVLVVPACLGLSLVPNGRLSNLPSFNQCCLEDLITRAL